MSRKIIISLFKCRLDCNPFETIENRPDGALMIWGLSSIPSCYDFQNYLDYIRDAIEMNKPK
jgi:hypothetical protein